MFQGYSDPKIMIAWCQRQLYVDIGMFICIKQITISLINSPLRINNPATHGKVNLFYLVYDIPRIHPVYKVQKK